MSRQSKKRIVSLLPAATEMVCALGCKEQLLGVSHECDYPPSVQSLDSISSVKINSHIDSASIHRDIETMLASALSIYAIDVKKIIQLQPDVILTQDLCEVCGVASQDLNAALQAISGKNVTVLSFSPKTLHDVEENILQLGHALNRTKQAQDFCHAWIEKFKVLKQTTGKRKAKLKVLALEWLNPVMVGGLWMQELMDMAGVEMIGPGKGEKAQTVNLDFLKSMNPDMVIFKPCGFSVAQSLKEKDLMEQSLIQPNWSAFQNNAIFIADGHHYFNRPGPRLFDSAELIAQLCDFTLDQRMPSAKFKNFWHHLDLKHLS